MTRKLKFIGAALFALLLSVTPALAITSHSLHHISGVAIAISMAGLGLCGTVVVTYAENLNAARAAVGFFPGGTTAPTAGQAAQMNSLGATVFMADTDTTAIVIHNWLLTAAQVAALEPWIVWWWTSAGTTLLGMNFTSSSTNVIVTKASGTGSGGTFNVILQNPNSLIQ